MKRKRCKELLAPMERELAAMAEVELPLEREPLVEEFVVVEPIGPYPLD